MALTNAQYDSLMREYNDKQMRNHQIMMQREKKIISGNSRLIRS